MSPEPPSGLSRAFIEQQRLRLLALRRQLLGAEQAALDQQRGFQREHGDEAAEEEEHAQDLSRREIAQALHDVDNRRLANVERALQKIDEGSYGRSDLSGEPIPLARLQITPEAVLTVQEERAREAHG
jgi:DnaK suppressor protein